jgi:hypothetical protein
MRNTVAQSLKDRIEIFKADPTKPPRDIVGFFLSETMKSDTEVSYAELFSMVSFTIFAGFAAQQVLLGNNLANMAKYEHE